ncbi:Protein LSM12 B [Choanephora cucurbitarum]|uniref:Protein LSM12 B n=1 Tax=Choanephora cucurbitarum TaxID=101091 RepID=A0A1C7MXK9_9FUNG|nr:Protein LSM12 B [Choanephora cucurbitarum]
MEEVATRQQKHHNNNTTHVNKKSLESMIGKMIKIKTASNEQLEEIISVHGESKKDEIYPIPLDRLKHREIETTKEFKNNIAKMGVGVTKEAQDIFNALSKTLPCRWSKDTIVVMDEILISPPYGVEDCKANATSAPLLARVKKVINKQLDRSLA